MDKDIKLKDEPVEEQSPELVNKKKEENPVREADGNYSIRNMSDDKEKTDFPAPTEDDRKYQNQDEYESVEQKNRT